MSEALLLSDTTHELPNPPRLKLVEGGIILGRDTNVTVEPDDFLDCQTLIHLSNNDVMGTFNRKPVIVRPKTLLIDIVRAVLDKTHADLRQDESFRRAITESVALYGANIDTRDPNTREDLEQMIAVSQNTDLLRGMQAFAEAEQQHHNSTYEYTLIQPAIQLAAWLIAIENE
jgi:hypothetical protein